MTEREPRRRRKKKDVGRKDESDIHVASQKLDFRDSDFDDEPSPLTTAHEPSEPSKIAQVIFIILFLAVAILMSSIFFALKDTKGLQTSDEVSFLSFPDLPYSVETEETVVDAGIPDLHDSEEKDVVSVDEELESEDIVDQVSESSHDVTEKSEDTSDENNLLSESEEEEEEEEDIVFKVFTPEPVESEQEFTPKPMESEHVAETETKTKTFVTEIPDVDNYSEAEILFSEIDDAKNFEPIQDIYEQKDFFDNLEDSDNLDMTSSPLYEKSDITNEEDYEIRETLDEIETFLEKSPEKALSMYNDLLKVHPTSPRANYGRSCALDKLADLRRSNKVLEEALDSYQDVMNLKGVPDKLYILAGNRCIDRLQFRGFVGRSVKLLHGMAVKFPSNITMQNQLAVGYLLIGQNKEAEKLFREILEIWPDSGFAKVHLGFILKTVDSKYEEAIKLMSEGIASREPGVIDGRFFMHLGDALTRVGKQAEAMEVYKSGVQEGLFLSLYQRSLYNVQGLSAKPWWNPYNTIYSKYFKMLEENWQSIKAEALSPSNAALYAMESEGLRDKGHWQQLELFARGRIIKRNCQYAPHTCSLIEQMPDAARCKRGQVKFSVVEPDTHVWAHAGPTNCRLRAHLGLVIPEGVSLRVADEIRTWKEGKVILFDDSFEHELWHNGSSRRFVLIVDFWHPELTAYQKASLSPI